MNDYIIRLSQANSFGFLIEMAVRPEVKDFRYGENDNLSLRVGYFSHVRQYAYW